MKPKRKRKVWHTEVKGKTWVALNWEELLAVADHCIKQHQSLLIQSVWLQAGGAMAKRSKEERAKLLAKAELYTLMAGHLAN